MPRQGKFFEILLSEDRAFRREEVKPRLFDRGGGADVSYTDRLLSGIFQFLTQKPNPHLRQGIAFEPGGAHGLVKHNYQIRPEYRSLLQALVDEWHYGHANTSAETHSNNPITARNQ